MSGEMSGPQSGGGRGAATMAGRVAKRLAPRGLARITGRAPAEASEPRLRRPAPGRRGAVGTAWRSVLERAHQVALRGGRLALVLPHRAPPAIRTHPPYSR